jgi:hypothetical protein
MKIAHELFHCICEFLLPFWKICDMLTYLNQNYRRLLINAEINKNLHQTLFVTIGVSGRRQGWIAPFPQFDEQICERLRFMNFPINFWHFIHQISLEDLLNNSLILLKKSTKMFIKNMNTFTKFCRSNAAWSMRDAIVALKQFTIAF